MAGEPKRDSWEELCDLIEEAGLRVVFWVCPHNCNGFVDWEHVRLDDGTKSSTPSCRECGEKGKAR